MREPRNTCAVVDALCIAPPAMAPFDLPRVGKCYRCGESVCRQCSSARVQTWGPAKGKRRRICHRCEADDAHTEPGGRDAAYARIYRRLEKRVNRPRSKRA